MPSVAGQNIWEAAGDGDLETVKHFIELGTSVNAKDGFGYTPLHAAVSYAHPELINYLLDRNADINITDNDGDTPLHACETVDIAQLLLDKGADPKIKNDDGKTPAMVANEEGWDEVAALLRGVTGESAPDATSTGEATLDDTRHLNLDHDELMQKVAEIMNRSEAENIEPDEQLRMLIAGLVMDEFQKGVEVGEVRDEVVIEQALQEKKEKEEEKEQKNE